MIKAVKQELHIFQTSLRNIMRNNILRVYFLFILFSVFFFTFFIPPFQKTDETLHFYKAVAVAKGQFTCKLNAFAQPENKLPAYLVNLPKDLATETVAFNERAPFPKGQFRALLTQNQVDTQLVGEPSACPLPFIFYLPAGIAMSIPVALNMNPLFIFYLGRLASLFFAGIIFYISLRILPRKYRWIVLYILALPMVLIQISSYNKEMMHMSFGVLAFSVLMALREKIIRISIVSLLTLFVSITLTVLTRPQYVLLFLLFLLLPFNNVLPKKLQFKLTKRVWIILLSIIGTGLFITAAIIFLILPNLAWFHTFAHDFRGVYPKLQMKYILQYPAEAVGVFFTTLNDSIFGLYSSYIGAYGWIHHRLAWYVYVIYGASFGYLVYKNRKDFSTTSWFTSFILSAIVTGTILSLFFAMYVYSTPVASSTILDIQGRYFIVLTPFFMWLVAFCLQKAKKILLYLVPFILITGFISAAYSRYYNYSAAYYYGSYTGYTYKNNTPFTKFNNSFIYKLPVQSGKKIGGISLFIHKQGDSTTKPYILRVLAPDCKTVIAEKVMSVESMKDNRFIEVTFPPFSIEADNVCLQIAPFDPSPMPPEFQEYFYLLRGSGLNEYIISPLYLH